MRPRFTTLSRQRAATLFLVLGASAWPSIASGQRAQLTLERITSSPSITGTAPSRPTWSPDSRRLAFLWNDKGMPARDVWLVDKTGTTPKRLTGGEGSAGGVSEFIWTPDSRAVVYLQAGDLWRIAADGGQPERLTTTGGGKSDLGISPDGSQVSFLENGDLWLRAPNGTVAQATKVGVAGPASVPLGTYNHPDVEVGKYVWGGDTPGYVWSRDGRFIAVQYADRRHIRKVPFPYYLGEETTVNVLRRGYPGDTNEIRRVGIYDVASGQLNFLDLPDPTAVQIRDFSWSPTGQLLVDRESDTAIDRWLHLADPVSRSVREIWHDHRETRVYNAIASGWHPDGKRVVIIGDLDDRYRLYAITPGSNTPKPLTSGPYDVTDGPIAVPATKSIVFVSTEPSPYERQVYRISDEGGPATRITTRPGQYTPFVSPDGSTVALLFSDDVSPTELYLTDAKGGSPERRITTSPPADFANFSWVRGRYVSFKSRIDNYTIHARILEPPGLDRSKKHPVIFGPVYSNTVRNRWQGLFGTIQQFLVLERGYIVVLVDVRGSTGYGRDFREEFLMDYGGEDLDDLQSAMEYLKTLPYVDTERAGIWGSSYGGLLTVYSLFKKPGLFKAGVAGAPAVDPRFFGPDDIAITRTPQSNPEAFQRGNATQYAGNLRDHLLIIQGMQDDVVPFKTTVALAEELMKLGKDFDFAFAPAATHGWSSRPHYARYLFRKLVDYFDRYLGQPGGP